MVDGGNDSLSCVFACMYIHFPLSTHIYVPFLSLSSQGKGKETHTGWEKLVGRGKLKLALEWGK